MALTIRPSDLSDDQLQLAFDRAARNEEIKKKFTGGNFRELAFEYDLTEVQIRSIVSDIVREVRARPMEGQQTLFGQENF